MTARIRALLFDLDKTIWYFPVQMPNDVVYARCAEQIGPLLAEWAIACDAVDLSRRILDGVEHARRQAVAGSLLSPDFGEVVDGVLRAAGIDLHPEQIDTLWAACQVDGTRLGRQLYPDTLTTLTWARQEGYRVGLISNRWSSGALTRRELDGYAIGQMFDSVTVSSDAGWLKPHPEIFYAALRDLGVEPDETAAVGDSLRTDIAPAKMLGMRAVWKRNGDRQQPDPVIAPDATIDDLWELRRLPALIPGPSPTQWERGA